jgi:hypothetical protein
MLWLFGQIWLWSLISFVLGAGLTALVFTRLNRERPEPFEDEPRVVEASEPIEPYDQEAEPEDSTGPVLAWPVEPDEVPESGHRQGTLPSYPPPPRRALEPGTTGEPAWPRADEWPPPEQRPGNRP